MIEGQRVNVLLYGGATGQRRVVADKGDIVVICSEEEYQSALREKRPPSGLGFPKEDVLDGTPEKKVPTSEVIMTKRAKAGD
ncbi:MAG: hypothetical protein ABSB15_22615 [Bryobacteraceae bacterium]|jgi:hypothetical protein